MIVVRRLIHARLIRRWALLVATIGAAVLLAPGLASAATSARTCRIVLVSHRVRGVVVHRRARVCESATILISRGTVPSGGGAVSLHYAATNATACTLGASPAFWTGRNPTVVPCRSRYAVTIPKTVNARRWTFRFIARNRYGQTVSVAILLSQKALAQPVVAESTNWSGYVLEGSGLHSAQGTFTVPGLSPTSGSSYVSEWVGVDGNTNTSLIQAGVAEQYDAISHTVLIYPWWEILPDPETPIGSMTVSVGDSVTATVQQLSATTWAISVVDNTTTQSFLTHVTYSGPKTSAEWILEAPTVNGAIAQLGVFSPHVTFSGLAAGGNRVLTDEIFMVQNGLVVSSPSALDANGFTVAYGPNPPPAP